MTVEEGPLLLTMDLIFGAVEVHHLRMGRPSLAFLDEQVVERLGQEEQFATGAMILKPREGRLAGTLPARAR